MPWLTYAVLIARGTGVKPGASVGTARSQKGSFDQSHQPRGELEMAASAPGRKSSTAYSITIGLASFLAGFTLIYVLQALIFFSDFFSNIFMCTHFEWANEIMLI